MTKESVVPISVDLLILDAENQARLTINEETVDDYAALIADRHPNWPFPPVHVFTTGRQYYVADGFHRVLAAKRTKRASIPCVLHPGGAHDARIFGMTANDRHGLRMTRADKRACVEWLLDHTHLARQQIAETAGVSLRLVQTIVAERKAKLAQPPTQPDPVTLPTPPSATQPDRPPQADVFTMPTPAPGASATPPPNVQNALSETAYCETHPLPPRPGGATSPQSIVQIAHSPPEQVAPAPPQSIVQNALSADSARQPAPCQRDRGVCPNCRGTEWDDDADGVFCAKCHHPWGEPVGDVDEGRVKIQQRKTIKTIEALMRAFDDLQDLHPRGWHGEIIAQCKALLYWAQNWLED